MAVDWDTWMQQMRQGGFGATDIPGMPSGAGGGPSQAWAGWELGQPGQLTAQSLAAPGYSGTYQQPAPVWATGMGTAQPAMPDGWQQLPASAMPNSGWSYQTISEGDPADTVGPQTKNPDGSTQHGGEPITPATAPTGEQSRDAGLAAIYGPAAAQAATTGVGGKVVKNTDGSWTLPNGTVIPANTATTINVNGQQVALPVYWNGGTYRFNLDGHQEDALTFLARRLTDAANRGQNVQDPNVIYDNLARIRDDMRAAGVADADLERLSGITGLHEFVRGNQVDANYTPPAAPGTAPGTPAAPAAPGGTAVSVPGLDPTNGGGQGGVTPGGSGNPQYNLDLQGNEVLRTAALLQRLGLGSPMAQSNMLGATRAQRATQLLDPWMQTQGMTGGNVADNFSSLMDKFVGYLTQSGGMGAIAGDARAAAQALPGNPLFANAPDNETIGMLKGFNQLANLPMNPWLQRAYGNLQDQSIAQYGNKLNEAAQGGLPLDFNYLGYIQQNPLFQFLTGQK